MKRQEPQRIGVRRHCVISGTGRAGTTFLVQLLTALGQDTGFSREHSLEDGPDFDPVAFAGLEWDLRDSRCPYIVKTPGLCDHIDQFVGRRDVLIDHAIVPIRDLQHAAFSRARVQARYPSGWVKKASGGFWDASSEDEQRRVLAEKLHRLLYFLAVMETPVTFLQYPRLVQDPVYLYERLFDVLDLAPSLEEFTVVFKKVAKPERIGGSGLADPVLPNLRRGIRGLFRLRR